MKKNLKLLLSLFLFCISVNIESQDIELTSDGTYEVKKSR
jgi:hypothetical protein